jgi:hypothetical protein
MGQRLPGGRHRRLWTHADRAPGVGEQHHLRGHRGGLRRSPDRAALPHPGARGRPVGPGLLRTDPPAGAVHCGG